MCRAYLLSQRSVHVEVRGDQEDVDATGVHRIPQEDLAPEGRRTGGRLEKVGKSWPRGRKKRRGGGRREAQVERKEERCYLGGEPSEGGHNGLTRSRASGGYSCCEIAESGSPRRPHTRILQPRTGCVFGKWLRNREWSVLPGGVVVSFRVHRTIACVLEYPRGSDACSSDGVRWFGFDASGSLLVSSGSCMLCSCFDFLLHRKREDYQRLEQLDRLSEPIDLKNEGC